MTSQTDLTTHFRLMLKFSLRLHWTGRIVLTHEKRPLFLDLDIAWFINDLMNQSKC